MEQQTLNATLDCIKETTTFSERIITNVCTGQVTTLPIGFWEMMFFGSLGLILLALGLIILAVVYSVIRDAY